MEAIDRIAEFVGVKPAKESLLYLSNFLGANSLRQLAEANQGATNSTGHEQVTYLHPGHIAESSSEQQCLRPRPFAWCKTRGPNTLIRG